MQTAVLQCICVNSTGCSSQLCRPTGREFIAGSLNGLTLKASRAYSIGMSVAYLFKIRSLVLGCCLRKVYLVKCE